MTSRVPSREDFITFPTRPSITTKAQTFPSRKSSADRRTDLNSRIELVIKEIKGRNNRNELLKGFDELIKSDKRFNGKDPQFSFSPEIVKVFHAKISELITQHPASKKKKDLTKVNQGHVDKIKSKLAPLLMQFVDRRPISTSTFESDNKKYRMSEKHGFFDKKGRQVEKSDSSEVQKGAQTSRTANLGWITVDQVNKDETSTAKRVILSRSARTDTSEKIIEKSRTDILARLNTTDQTGLLEVQEKIEGVDKIYTYTRVDVTFMDSNPLKALWTRLISMRSKVSENEKAFLKAKRDAVEKFWSGIDSNLLEKDSSGNLYYEHDLKIRKEDGTTKVIRVREYKPIVLNHLLSGQANFSFNVDRARKSNIENTIRLFKPNFNPSVTGRYGSITSLIRSAIDKYEISRSPKDLAKLESEIKKEIISSPRSEQWEVLRDFYFCLKGKYYNDSEPLQILKYDSVHGSTLQLIITVKYAKIGKTALSVECKSGNDRTATAVAIACAQEKFEMIYKKPFVLLPEDHEFKTPQEKADYYSNFNDFKKFFNDYIEDFGKQTVLASRGRPVLKAKSSPVFRIFADIKRLEKTFIL